jgi:predicted nucleic acid-binding protein
MAIYLLDTNIIIDAINAEKNRNQALIRLAEAGNVLACCPVNIAEVYAGVRPKEEQLTAEVLHSLKLYPVTFDVAELAGRLKRDYVKKGKTLGLTYTLVAAVALHHGLQLITDNVKDFPMPDLSIYHLPS